MRSSRQGSFFTALLLPLKQSATNIFFMDSDAFYSTLSFVWLRQTWEKRAGACGCETLLFLALTLSSSPVRRSPWKTIVFQCQGLKRAHPTNTCHRFKDSGGARFGISWMVHAFMGLQLILSWPVRRGCTSCKAAKDLNPLFDLSRRPIESTTSQNDLVQLIGKTRELQFSSCNHFKRDA